MKTKLPLPQDTDQKVLISVTDKLGYPFTEAASFNVYFSQVDIDYITRNIIVHPAFRAVKHNITTNNNANIRRLYTGIQFFELFRNNSKCPTNVKAFLDQYIGWLYFCLNRYKTNTVEQFFIDRWMETCR